jgi:hypothetical protein
LLIIIEQFDNEGILVSGAPSIHRTHAQHKAETKVFGDFSTLMKKNKNHSNEIFFKYSKKYEKNAVEWDAA